jgi:spermidine synthase
MAMPLALIFSLLVLGFSGIVAQTVLIRESLIIYGGNELSLRIIIGAWVIWGALGAYAGGRLPRDDGRAPVGLVTANILFILFFPATIAAIRTLKIIIGLVPEMSLGITAIFASSLVIFLPCAIAHGYAFTAACRMYERASPPGEQSAARGYFFEMAGTVIGGIVVSYIFITRLHPVRIAFVVFSIMSFACLILGLGRTPPGTRPRRAIAAAGLVLISAGILGMSFGLDTFIENRSISAEWHGRTIVSYRNSPYQNIVVTKEKEQYTFFTDGAPAATLPIPDIVRTEEIVHIPGLAHGSPREVLIIHGGYGGVIHEMLKYPMLRHIDYVEMDPHYLQAIAYFPSGPVPSELTDRRVRVHYTDGRRFVKETSGRYDVIISGIPAPRTLQANRFFTREFFHEVKNILKPDGIFMYTLPGSLAYYDRELKDMNASILMTAGEVFAHIAIVPGEENIFMASSMKEALDLSPDRMDRRLKEYALLLRLISLPHLSYRLDPERAEWFRSTIRDSQARANQDLAPMGLWYTIAFDNALHDPSLRRFFAMLEKYGFVFLLLTSFCIGVAGFALSRRSLAVPICFVTLTTGFSAMVLELLLILIYQVWSGYVFHEIGMLITMLMTGMALGALSAGRCLKKFGSAFRALVATETVLALTGLIVPAIFLMTGLYRGPGQLSARLLLMLLLFLSGFFAGVEYPIAVEAYRTIRPQRTAVGPIYGLDLLGGFAGGIAGGFFLFPVVGLVKTCIFLFAVKVCGILMLLYRKEK